MAKSWPINSSLCVCAAFFFCSLPGLQNVHHSISVDACSNDSNRFPGFIAVSWTQTTWMFARTTNFQGRPNARGKNVSRTLLSTNTHTNNTRAVFSSREETARPPIQLRAFCVYAIYTILRIHYWIRLAAVAVVKYIPSMARCCCRFCHASNVCINKHKKGFHQNQFMFFWLSERHRQSYCHLPNQHMYNGWQKGWQQKKRSAYGSMSHTHTCTKTGIHDKAGADGERKRSHSLSVLRIEAYLSTNELFIGIAAFSFILSNTETVVIAVEHAGQKNTNWEPGTQKQKELQFALREV